MTDSLTNTNPSGFELLLRALHQDRNQAGALYERLRSRLVKFFFWEQCRTAEELADICLDRVCRKLEEGTAIENIPAYAGAVARLVLKEHFAQEERSRAMHYEFARRQALDSPGSPELLIGQLEKCLEKLSVQNQRLVRRYYQGSQSSRIRNREKLAAELNVSLNALRNRAMRLREALEKCISRALSDESQDRFTKGEGGEA